MLYAPVHCYLYAGHPRHKHTCASAAAAVLPAAPLAKRPVMPRSNREDLAEMRGRRQAAQHDTESGVQLPSRAKDNHRQQQEQNQWWQQ